MAEFDGPARPMRSRADRIEGLRHVSYEAWMAGEAYRCLREMSNDDDSSATVVQWNATIESGLLHARSLLDFFCPKQTPKAEDMTPDDFAPEWNPEPADAVQRLRMNRRLLNTDLAHLSWQRVTRASAATQLRYSTPPYECRSPGEVISAASSRSW